MISLKTRVVVLPGIATFTESTLGLTESKFSIQINQSCDAYHIAVQALCKGFVVLAAEAIWELHMLVASLHIQINSTFLWPSHYAYYINMVSCIS
jgi:hypothetical protein